MERSSVRIPVVIYMHGNASARVEVLPQLTVLLALGVAVFAFDFAGSGKSKSTTSHLFMELSTSPKLLAMSYYR